MDYGIKIKYDLGSQITMTLPADDDKIIKIFKDNYQLPIISEEYNLDGSETITYTFSDDVDQHTFLRHLKTASPGYYDKL